MILLLGPARNFLAVWPLMRFSRQLGKGPGRVHILTLSQSNWHTRAHCKWLYCWTYCRLYMCLFLPPSFIIMGMLSDVAAQPVYGHTCKNHYIGSSKWWDHTKLDTFCRINSSVWNVMQMWNSQLERIWFNIFTWKKWWARKSGYADVKFLNWWWKTEFTLNSVSSVLPVHERLIM